MRVETDAQVVAAIERAKSALPTLSKNGFLQPTLRKVPYLPGRNTMFEYDEKKHLASREEMTSKASIAEFRTAMAYLLFDGGPLLTGKVSYALTSYGWKHYAERWAHAHGYHPYVSNGIFICAALNAGCRVEPIENNPNARLNLSRRMLPSQDAFREAIRSLPYRYVREYAHGMNKLDWPARRSAA